MAETLADQGGKGDVQLKRLTVLGIYRAAITNGYNLTREQRRAIVREAFCILEDSESEKRERISAAKVLLAADKLDLEAERMARGANMTQTNVQVNVQNGLDLSKLTPEQLRALAGE